MIWWYLLAGALAFLYLLMGAFLGWDLVRGDHPDVSARSTVQAFIYVLVGWLPMLIYGYYKFSGEPNVEMPGRRRADSEAEGRS